MQVGKIHGLALAILGVVLLGLQHGCGAKGIFVTRRKADEPETKYAIK
jgi:hypothetical protein